MNVMSFAILNCFKKVAKLFVQDFNLIHLVRRKIQPFLTISQSKSVVTAIAIIADLESAISVHVAFGVRVI